MTLKRRRLTIPFADASARRAFIAGASGGGGPAFGIFRRIACVGDSITQGYNGVTAAAGGWPSLLAASNPGATIINLGAPGATATDAATSFPAWLASNAAPDLTIVSLGVNDLYNSTLAAYVIGMNTVLSAAKNAGSEVAIVIEPPQGNGHDLTPFVQAAYALGESYGAVFYVDIFARWVSSAAAVTAGLQYSDAVHPTDLGYADIVIPVKAALAAAVHSMTPAPYGVPVAPVAWFKADSLVNKTASAAVAAWGDSSQRRHVLTKNAGGTPTYRTSVFSPGALFFAGAGSGGNAYMNTSFAELAAVSALTIFVVYARGATGLATMALHPANGAGEFFPLNDGSVYGYIASGISGKYALADTSKHVHELIFDGTQTGNAARLIALSDGAVKTLTFAGTVPAVTTSETGLGVGGLFNDATFSFNGDIAEVLIFATALSSARRSTIRQALGTKWGVTVAP